MLEVIDLNCDMGESYGIYTIGTDEDMMKYITSANIACGYHGGDPSTIRRTVKLCIKHEVAIGAHPGLPDLFGFGRRAMAISPDEAYDMIVYQVGAVSAFAQSEGALLHHVKPHGALYNIASTDPELAAAIAEAIYRIDPRLILYGLAGSELLKAGRNQGLRCASEAFIDRSYQADGTLTPRSQHNAVIRNVELAAAQALQIVKHQEVITAVGTTIPIQADTLCIHGDSTGALQYASKLRQVLEAEGIGMKAM